MGLDRHLFLLNADELDLSGLEDFYTSVLKAWKLLKATREEGIEPTAWFLGEVQQALSQQVQELLELPQGDAAPEFPSMRVTAADGGWQENRGILLTFSSPSLRLFEDADGKALYTVCVKVKNLRALAEVRENCWHDLLGGQSMAGFRWRVLYKLPVPKSGASVANNTRGHSHKPAHRTLCSGSGHDLSPLLRTRDSRTSVCTMLTTEHPVWRLTQTMYEAKHDFHLRSVHPGPKIHAFTASQMLSPELRVWSSQTGHMAYKEE
ncbi:hypothetical protein MHYP_G00091130 [Metynnis hypsauchen]